MDGDNDIDQVDLDLLSAWNGLTSADFDWIKPDSAGNVPLFGDLDRDGDVNEDDYDIAYANNQTDGDA